MNKEKLRNLPCAESVGVEKRMETGPVRFGEDWPGLFLRGDNCMAYAMMLQRFIEAPHDQIARMTVKGLLSVLRSAVCTRDDVPLPENPHTPLDNLLSKAASVRHDLPTQEEIVRLSQEIANLTD